MYAIHTTPGFIIGSHAKGEAGKLLSIFTRDLGLILASAQGIRLEKSKLRYATQDYSLGEFSFVRGKEFWRLTDASLRSRVVYDRVLYVSSAGQALTVRIAFLLKRLLHGEEAHPELYECIAECLHFLNSSKNLSNEQMETLESLTVARILYLLGYIGDDRELNGHLKSVEISEELLNTLKDSRVTMNKHINKALKESHL